MIRRFVLALSLFGLLFVAAPSPAFAKDLYGNVNCSAAGQSAVCQARSKESKDPISGKDGALLHIANIVSIIAGAAAVIVIIISAIRFATSGSDISTYTRTDNDVEQARNTLTGAVIGLAVIIAARTLIFFVINKL